MTHPVATQKLLDFLHSEGRLRVWSLIVTILGDVAEAGSGPMPMKEILSILGGMGIEEQAVRTAMSRLQKEGLVQAIRTGRTAHYGFSASGRLAYREAAKSVYAQYRPVQNWVGLVLPSGDARDLFLDKIRPYHPLICGASIAVWARDSQDFDAAVTQLPANQLVFMFDQLPDWAAVIDAPVLSTKIADIILSAVADIRDAQGLCVLQKRTLRVLVIHFWRRLVLRFPPVQAPIENWPLARVHHVVSTIYHQLDGPADRF